MTWKTLRANKFHAKKTQYNNVTYDSSLEADYARTLDILRSAANPKDRVILVDRRVKYVLSLPPNEIVYRLDFRVRYADRHTEHIEVKGFETPTWKMKHKLMKEKFPHIDIRIIK
jgi:hypothetical protein